MQYTPQQVMAAVGLPQQTLRYWRKVLPPLASRDGHTACFTFSDLIALKVIHMLTNEAGIVVGTVAAMAQSIFDACVVRMPVDAGLEASLRITPRSGRVRLVAQPNDERSTELEITVPLGRCIDELLTALQDDDAEIQQFFLPLPLTAVNAKRNRA